MCASARAKPHTALLSKNMVLVGFSMAVINSCKSSYKIHKITSFQNETFKQIRTLHNKERNATRSLFETEKWFTQKENAKAFNSVCCVQFVAVSPINWESVMEKLINEKTKQLGAILKLESKPSLEFWL